MSPEKPQPRHTSSGFRSLFGRFRGNSNKKSTKSADIDLESAKTPRLVKAFVNSLVASQLSDFLSWFLYHDVVELPESPSHWYKAIGSMELRGWIALGAFLAKNPQHGFDLVVLDSICDRLKLPKSLVWECLIQFGDPEKMAWTQVATAIKLAKHHRMTELETLATVQDKLRDLYQIAKRLKPTAGSMFADMLPIIMQRLQDLQKHIITPRVDLLTQGRPRTANSTDIDRNSNESNRITYLYETMQQERQVPLIRYGIFPNPSISPSTSQSSKHSVVGAPIIDEALVNELCQAESTYTVAKLKSENEILRIENDNLNSQVENLTRSNNKFAKKVAMIGRGQPAHYMQQDWSVGPVVRSNSLKTPQVPHAGSRPRSSSDGPQIVIQQAAIHSNASQQAPPPEPHWDKHVSLAWKYEDVFSALDDKPLPALPLIDPTTGDEFLSATPPSSSQRTTGVELIKSAWGSPSRRGGLVRSIGTNNLVATVGSGSSTLIPSEGSSRSVSDGSRISGQQNITGEVVSHQLNTGLGQRPAMTYADVRSRSPLEVMPNTVTGLVQPGASHENFPDLDHDVDDDRKPVRPVRTGSFSSILDAFLGSKKRDKEEEEEETGPNISTNF